MKMSLKKLGLLTFLLSPSGYAADYEEFTCASGDTVISEPGSHRSLSKEIPSDWLLADQQKSSSCYAYSAAFLLDYLKLMNDSQAKRISPALLAKLCQPVINDGGFSFFLTQGVKDKGYIGQCFANSFHDDVSVFLSLDADWNTLSKKIKASTDQTVEDLVESILPKTARFSEKLYALYGKEITQTQAEFTEMFKEKMVSWLREDRSLFSKDLHELFGTVPPFSNAVKNISFPPYNVYSYSFAQEREEEIEKKIRDYFSDSKGSVYPLAASFESEKGGSHNIVITGYERKCCVSASGTPPECKPVISIVNSYGGKYTGQYLLKGFLKDLFVDYIKPCSHEKTKGELEPCVPGIQGPDLNSQFYNAFMSGNLLHLKNLEKDKDLPRFKEDRLRAFVEVSSDIAGTSDNQFIKEYLDHLPFYQEDKLLGAVAEMNEEFIRTTLPHLLVTGSERSDFKLIHFLSQSKGFHLKFKGIHNTLKKLNKKVYQNTLSKMIRTALVYKDSELFDSLLQWAPDKVTLYTEMLGKKMEVSDLQWMSDLAKADGPSTLVDLIRRILGRRKTTDIQSSNLSPKKDINAARTFEEAQPGELDDSH